METISEYKSIRGLQRRTSVETIKAGVGMIGSLRKKSSQSNLSINSSSSGSGSYESGTSSQSANSPRTYSPSIKSFRSYTVSSAPTTPPISPPRRSSKAHTPTIMPDPFSATSRNSWFSPEFNL